MTTQTGSWSYAGLVNAAVQIARSLKSQPNFEAGSRVVLLLGNSFEYIAAFYGTLLADGVVVPLPPNVEDQMLKRVLTTTEAVTIISPSETKRHAALLNALPAGRLSLGSEWVSRFEPPLRHGDELAGIFLPPVRQEIPRG